MRKKTDHEKEKEKERENEANIKRLAHLRGNTLGRLNAQILLCLSLVFSMLLFFELNFDSN